MEMVLYFIRERRLKRVCSEIRSIRTAAESQLQCGVPNMDYVYRTEDSTTPSPRQRTKRLVGGEETLPVRYTTTQSHNTTLTHTHVTFHPADSDPVAGGRTGRGGHSLWRGLFGWMLGFNRRPLRQVRPITRQHIIPARKNRSRVKCEL